MQQARLRLILAGLISLLSVVTSRASAAPGANNDKTVIIQLQGEVDDYNRDQLFRQFDQARKFGAHTIILNVDTYGGLLTSGLEISRYIKRQDDLHVIAFVQDKAISAGAMIAMACDEIVMSSSSSLGDCAPIVFGQQGLEAMPAAERAKAEGPVLLDFAESAARNHHDPLLSAAMVDVSKVVYWVQNDQGQRRFVDQTQYNALLASKQWQSVPGAPCPVDGPDTLLTVDSDQAVRYGLATGTAASAQALASNRGYSVVADISPTAGDKVVELLGSTFVRGILLVVFLQCLYIVLHAPGHGVAETCGVVALGLMLGVPLLTGYAQWWEILTIFVGLALVALEILVPGHFVPGICGLILVFFGVIMTFVPKEPGGLPTILPGLHASLLSLRKGVTVVGVSLLVSMVMWAWLSRFLPKMPYFNRLVLTATSGNLPATGIPESRPIGEVAWPPIGAIGRAVSELRPGGSAEFFDARTSDTRITSVVSENGFLAVGTEVVVRELVGPSIVVRQRI